MDFSHFECRRRIHREREKEKEMGKKKKQNSSYANRDLYITVARLE
jgi:hypothetical protein